MPILLRYLSLGLLLAPSFALSNEIACERESLLPERRLTLFGELHGTNETPLVVADHVCRLSTKRPVVLVLEIPRSEQAAIDRYLSSDGRRASRKQLIDSAFWAADWQDGRASIAMFDLIDRVRELNTKGAKIAVVADDGFSGQDRDLVMSETLAASMREAPDAAVVGLFGNYHTGEIIGTRSNPDHQRIGYRLRSFDPLTVAVEPARGWAWLCSPKCGISSAGFMKAAPSTPSLRFVHGERNGHDAVLILPRATPAPPARLIADEG